jgi:hypothetical protein
MGLSVDRNTPQRNADDFVVPVDAGMHCFAGGLAVLAAGYAQPASTALNLIAIGIFEENVDNSLGNAGDLTAKVRSGCFRFNNSANADAITLANVGNVAFIVDDETVAATDGGSTRSPAGKIVDVDDLGVWVMVQAHSPAVGLNS